MKIMVFVPKCWFGFWLQQAIQSFHNPASVPNQSMLGPWAILASPPIAPDARSWKMPLIWRIRVFHSHYFKHGLYLLEQKVCQLFIYSSTVSSMNSWLKSTTNSQASRFAKVPQFQNKSRYSSKMFEGKLAKSFHQVAGEHIAATCAKSI